jgi:hypothetical protein
MPTSVPRRARRAQVARSCSTLFYLWISESSFPLQVPLFFIPSLVSNLVFPSPDKLERPHRLPLA